MDWMSIKVTVAEATALSRDALHLVSGIGGQLLLVLLFRSWFGALWPLGVIALAAVANEWSDLSDPWPGDERAVQWWESVKDVAVTLALPLLLVLLARFAPSRFARQQRPAEASE